MSRAIQDATGCREALTRLPKLGLRELRQQWRILYKADASPHLSRELLLRAVAYRMQEVALGGLCPEPRRQLLRIAQQFNLNPAVSFGSPAGPGTCEERRVAGRFRFNPKKSGPDHAVPVIFLAMAESER